MRQEFLDPARRLRRQALAHVLKIPVRIVTVELGGLDQAHDHRGALTGAQGSSVQPVGSTESDGTDAVLETVVEWADHHPQCSG